MNIGIDIDGVLTNFERELLDYGTKMSVEENWCINNIKLDQYDESKVFDWNEKQTMMFWNKYIIKYFIETPVRTFAPEVIKKLRQEGNKIYFITARDDYGVPSEYCGKVQQITDEWLKAQNIEYEKLIFAKDQDKLQQCLENNIDVMIEDSPKNIKNISSKIKVIKFDCQYNKNVDGENIAIAYSWYHIYSIIKEMRGD